MAQPHRTVSRVLHILEAAAAAGEDGVTLARLATQLSSAKSSIHGFVQGLVAEGYLVDFGGRYHLGPALAVLTIGQTMSLGQYALPLMRELRDELNETVTLGIRVRDSIVYTDSVQSTNVICYSAPLRSRRPMWPTSAGKIFLASEPKLRAALLRATAEAPLTDEQVDAALVELEEVAQTGMAFNRGETVKDVSAVAVGIYRGGELIGAVSVAGPRDRLAPRLAQVGALTQSRFQQLTESRP